MKPGSDAWVVALELAGHPRWSWRAGVRAGLVPGGLGGGVIREPLWWRLVLWQNTLGGAPEVGARGAVAVWTDWLTRTGAHSPPIVDLYDPATVGVLLGLLPLGWSVGSPGPDGRGDYAIVLDGRVDAQRGTHLGVAVARALLALWGDT